MTFRDEARWWTVSFRTAAVLFAIPPLGAGLVALALLYGPLYRFVLHEDSVLEWAQVLGYAVACVTALYTAWLVGGAWAAVLCLFALGCFGLLGEEVSWGERILRFHTPAVVAHDNQQGEFNVHNLTEVSREVILVQMLIGIAGATIPWLLTGRRYVPPRFLTSAFAVIAVYFFVRYEFVPTPGYEFAKYSEWPEACFSLAVATFGVLTLRKAAAPLRARRPGDRRNLLRGSEEPLLGAGPLDDEVTLPEPDPGA